MDWSRTKALALKEQLVAAGYQVRALDLLLTDKGDLADYCRLHGADTVTALALLPDLSEDQGTQPGNGSVEPEKDSQTAANLWLAAHPGEWAFDMAKEAWHRWAGTHWAELETRDAEQERQVKGAATDAGLKRSKNRVADVLFLAGSECSRDFGRPNAGLVNFQNGTLEVSSKTLRPHRPDDNLTYCLPFGYAPGDYPTIQAALSQNIPDPVGVQAYMTHLGLGLLGDVKLHKSCLLMGERHSGKTTLLALANLVWGNGDEPFSFPSSMLFSRELEGMRSRATWAEARGVCIDELPIEALQSEELFKQMAAHSGVGQRKLQQEEIRNNRWRPKLLMSTNDPPQYRDRSGALTERLIIIDCPNYRPEGQRDLDLLDRLKADLPAFASACLDLAQKALETGSYPQSEQMRGQLSEIEISGDTIKRFCVEKCVLDKSAMTSVADLHGAYCAECAEWGITPMGKPQFSRVLSARYGIEHKPYGKQRQRVLLGIRLRQDTDPDEPTR